MTGVDIQLAREGDGGAAAPGGGRSVGVSRTFGGGSTHDRSPWAVQLSVAGGMRLVGGPRGSRSRVAVG